MSTNVVFPSIGGSTYSVPAAGEKNWPDLSNFLVALAGAQPQTNQKVAVRKATTTPVTVVAATDCIIVTDLAAAGAVAVTLPAGNAGQYFIIIDGKGDADTNNITITPNGAETIKGSANLVLSAARGAVLLVYNSGDTDWKVFGPISGSSSLVTPSSTTTFTNKTIDGDTNTVQDLAISSLKTVIGNASKFLSFDASGVPQATKAVPSGVVVGTTDSQTITNKVIDGDDNTVQDLALTSLKTVLADADKVLRRDASGIVVSSNAVPNTSTLVTTDATQTLTNKSISGSSNTLTNVSLTSAVSGTLPIGSGGTGQTTANTALNALLPSQATNANKALVTDGTNTSWVTVATAVTATPTVQGLVTSFTPVILSSVKTVSSANYTILDTDGYESIFVTTGTSNRTITFPTAANNAGRRIVIMKMDSAEGFVLTSGLTASSNARKKLFLQYETLTAYCDGSSWYTSHYLENNEWFSFTASGQGFGTLGSQTCYWRRANGSLVEVRAKFTPSAVSSVEARLNLPLINGAVQLTLGTTVLTSNSQLGATLRDNSGANQKSFTVLGLNGASSSYVNFGVLAAEASSPFTALNADSIANAAVFSCFFTFSASNFE